MILILDEDYEREFVRSKQTAFSRWELCPIKSCGEKPKPCGDKPNPAQH